MVVREYLIPTFKHKNTVYLKLNTSSINILYYPKTLADPGEWMLRVCAVVDVDDWFPFLIKIN